MKMNIIRTFKDLLPLWLSGLMLALPSLTTAQNDGGDELRVITGCVTDAAQGNPMVGVRVQAYNNALYAAMTKEDGTYSIKVPEYVTSITFAFDGCNTLVRSVADASDNSVDVKMFPDKFSEIYTTTTSSVKSKTVKASGINADLSIDQQIQSGFLGDAAFRMRSGQLGAGVTSLLSGINSLNISTQPLLVIDGVITDIKSEGASVHDGFYSNLLANIMVEDIESITVLKSGLAIYGAKGANGVILINTKRNNSMVTKIDVSAAGSFMLTPKHIPLMDASQYRNYASELLGSTNGPTLSEYKFMSENPYYYNTYHNETDWTKEAYRNSFVQNYSINVQGGDEVANYNLSVGYAKGNATLKNNDYSRFNMRLNSDIILGNRLTVKFDASYSDVTRDMRDDGAPVDMNDGTVTAPGFLSMIKAPFLNPYEYDINQKLSTYLCDNDDYLYEVLGDDASLANPVSILRNGDGINKNYVGSRLISIAITPRVEINRYWHISEHFSYTMINGDENYYLPVFGVPQFKVAGIGKVNNKVAALSSQQNAFMSNTYFNYDKRFNAHDLHVSGGFRIMSDSYTQTNMLGFNSGNDKTPNMSTDLNYKTTNGVDIKEISLTAWAQGNYNYREKYYLNLALGVSSSSRFGNSVSNGIKMFGVPWGIFPSASAAWVMSSEPWFKAGFINYLKLNAAFDLTGNDSFDDTASSTYFSPVRLLNTTGLVIGNIGNSSLQWETTTKGTFGLDAILFNNYLTLSANAFISSTSNLLSISRLSYLTGIENTWSNGGSLKNSGFDVSASVKLMNRKNFTWEAGLSVGKYKNELTALPDNDRAFNTEISGATIRSEVGQPVGVFYGYTTEGVFANSEAASAADLKMKDQTGSFQNFKAGDMHFTDRDGNHIIDEKDMTKIGDPNPDLYGRLFTTLTFKGFTLSATFNYSLGNDVFNYQRMLLESGSRFNNQTVAVVNRWRYEGQVTDVPAIAYGDPMGNSRFSDRWIEDGSYLRLRNVTLSYKLPIRNAIIQGITVWGSANNLFTITKYLGTDPEFSMSDNILSQGIDRGLLPQSRNFSIGVKINL